jgi:hypothetical protein
MTARLKLGAQALAVGLVLALLALLIWKLVNDNNGGRYDTYQSMTTRQIPVVAITPN